MEFEFVLLYKLLDWIVTFDGMWRATIVFYYDILSILLQMNTKHYFVFGHSRISDKLWAFEDGKPIITLYYKM